MRNHLPVFVRRVSRAGRWCAAAAVILSITACGGSARPGSGATPASTVAAVALAPTPAFADAPTTVAPTAHSPVDAPTTLSPLAAEIAAGARDLPSALYDPATATANSASVVPASISIPALDVSEAPVEPVGVTDAGELDVPGPKVVGWYRFGSTPEQAGSTVLAAHVDYNRVPGVFRYLTKLDTGDEITLTLSDGQQRRYVVSERTMYDKDKLPPDRVWSRTGEPTLVLLTCGGQFNSQRRSFEQNIVVFARPV